MSNPSFPFAMAAASAILALSGLAPAPAFALAPVTFVSGKGVDSGTCATPESPCRTFQYALGLTNAGGEIKALDPANYFSLYINKSINITGVDGAGIIRGTVGDAVTINAGATGAVILSNLTIDGVNRIATNGINLNSAASLTVKNCMVRNFAYGGIRLATTTALKFLIADTEMFADADGVIVGPMANVSVKGVLDRVTLTRNGYGAAMGSIYLTSSTVDVTIVDSVVSDNSGYGLTVDSRTILRLRHSTLTRNDWGVVLFASGAARSSGDNFIDGNTTGNVYGAMTNVGMQ